MTLYSRRNFVKLSGVGFASLTMGSLLSSCSADGASQAYTSSESRNEVIVVMNTGSEPASGFDPLFSWGCGEHVHEPLIQSTLITTTVDMGFENDLATSYLVSEDGLEWTFTLRDDVVFTDGHPLTAHDVAFTIKGIIESEGSEADLSMVDDARAVDDKTVVLTLNKPYNALLFTLAVVGIVPEHAYDEGYGRHPIGSGRYMLEQWDEGQQVILTANPDYYGERPLMERVVIAFMEEDASLAAARSGQADIVFTSATYSQQEVSGYELLACKTVDSRGVSLPTEPRGGSKSDGETEYEIGNDVTSDIAIRQAMNYALDRQNMADNVLNGYGTVAYSVCDNMPWASEDMKVNTDVEYAKQLLDAAGWQEGADGIREKDGVKATFDLVYSSNDSVRQALAEEFSSQMEQIGIEVLVKGAGWDDLYPNQYKTPILWGWGSNSPTELYELNYSSGWGNFSGYESGEVDSYLDQALAQNDIDNSYELWKSAQWDGKNGIAPQGAATWIWFVSVDHLYFKREALQVANQKLHPHGHGWSLVNDVDRWTWD